MSGRGKGPGGSLYLYRCINQWTTYPVSSPINIVFTLKMARISSNIVRIEIDHTSEIKDKTCFRLHSGKSATIRESNQG